MKKLFYILIFSFLPILTYANDNGGLVPCGGPGQPDCDICHLFVLLNNVIHFILWDILPYFIPIMFVIAGIYFVIAYISPEKGEENIKKGRGIFKAVIIGMVIVYGAWTIVGVFFWAVGFVKWDGLDKDTWFEIDCSFLERQLVTNEKIENLNIFLEKQRT